MLGCVLPPACSVFLFISLLTLLGLRGCARLSLFAASRGSACGAWAVGVGSGVVARGLGNAGSAVVVRRLSCPAACGVFLDQPSNPPASTGGFLSTGLPGEPQSVLCWV